ncbi:MAG: hypothetical protein HRU40_10505 [Saprospiraceae bacterium]|nr:hypothetical protein [Saprospiraceae bacterium]
MDQKPSLLGVFQTLYSFRKYIIIICGIAGIGTAVISLVLPDYYRSTTLFYAASLDLVKPEILYGKGNQIRSFFYGGESDIDRLITIGESSELLDYLVDSFDLYEVYEINPSHPKAPIRVRKELLSLYSLQKDKRDAIILSIEDKDPIRAAQMTNAAREKVNTLARNLIQSNQSRTLSAYRENIIRKEENLKRLGDSLATLREKFDIYNIDAQSEMLTTQVSITKAKLVKEKSKLASLNNDPRIPSDTIAYIQANVKGLETQVSSLMEQMNQFRDGMAVIMNVEKQYLDANVTVSIDRERAKQLQSTLDSDIPSIILLEEARVPIIKSRPHRSLLVIAAGALAFIFSILGVLLFDTYKKVDWNKVIHES